MVLTLLMFSLLLLGDLSNAQTDKTEEGKDCGPGWEFIRRGCYKFVWENRQVWENANLDCQSASGELMSVSDVAEFGEMKNKMKDVDKTLTWWVGLKKTGGQFMWLDKGDFNFRITRWKAGEPNNEGNAEDCVEIDFRGQINDKECSSARPYICERHEITPRPKDMTTEPPTLAPSSHPSTTPTTTTPSPTTTTTITTPSPPPPSSSSTTPITSSTTTTATTPTTTTNAITTTSTASPTTTTTTVSSSSTTTATNAPTTTSDSEVVTSPVLPSREPSSTRSDVRSLETSLEPRNAESNGNQGRGQGELHPQSRRTTPLTITTTSFKNGTPKPTTTTTAATTTTTTPDPYEVYAGCFMLQMRGGRDRFLYTMGSTFCPALEASGVEWPKTSHGQPAIVPCRGGREGNMTFECGGEPTCWRGQPVVDQCVSPRFKAILSLLSTTDVEKNDTSAPEPPEPEQTIEVTSQLAEVTTSDDVTQEDIVATSNVINSLVASGATTKVHKKEAIQFVSNVIKAGSNLVSTNKTKVWSNMAKHDRTRSATSLLVAMESATVAMAEGIDEPTTINTKDENIEMELRVVNVSSSTEDSDEELLYDSEDSDNQFSIPIQTLSHLSRGGLAKVVFMTHYSIGDILQDSSSSSASSSVNDRMDDGLTGTESDPMDEEDEEDGTKKESAPPQLASYILSASVSGSTGLVKLPKPISFTMRHIKNVPEGYYSMCSFWSISDSGLGEWSQEGCRVRLSNASQTTCECDHMTNFAVLMAVQEVELSELHTSMLKLVTIVGCIISCMCLLASWITFTCFSSLQGERNSIHKNLVVCLFVAEMLFLTGIDQTQNRLACGIVAGLLHYFFLAAFLWMFLEGVHIILMLVQVFDASRSRLPYYYAAAYGPPVLVIAISAGFFHQGYGTENYCWLTTDRYFIWSFAGPVAAILFTNTIILIYAMTMVCRHSEYVFGGKEKTTAEGIRSWIQGALALEVLLGLTWIIGFFFLSEHSVAVAYVFTVLNSTQGLFIFVFHCLFNKKARKEYRRVMKVKRRASMTTGTGSGTHSTLKNKNTLSGHSFNKHTNSTSGGTGSLSAENPHYQYHFGNANANA